MTGAIDTGLVWVFLLLWLAIVPVPGANSLMITHTALTRPPAHVAFALLGNITGILLLAVAALVGMAVLLETVPGARIAVHVIGGSYLIYFGLRLLQRARAAFPSGAAVSNLQTISRTEPIKGIGLGLATALSNTQAILFLTSIFAGSGVLKSNGPTQLAVLGVIVGCNTAYLSTLGWLFQREPVRRAYNKFRPVFESVVGLAFVGFGVQLMWQTWNSGA